LKATVFIAGASVMVVEILASRVIAPYYGSSTYVWSALIAVVLASMSMGYYFGGRLADKEPSYRRLSWILLASSVSVFVIPLLQDFILSLTRVIFNFTSGSIIASLVLLSPTGFFLGIVSPYAIRLSAKGTESIGSTAGSLYALSTAGSISGTLAAGFILIPYVKMSTIFFCVSLTLLACSALLEYKTNRSSQKATLLVVFLCIPFFNLPYLYGRELVYMEYTPYGRIIVDQNNVTRYLWFDDRADGSIRRGTGLTGYEYANYFELPFLMNQNITDILVAGEGTGVGPRQVHMNHPNTRITVSEIDPKVNEVAKKYFLFEEGDGIEVSVGDVRPLVRYGSKKYDYVILDAFRDTQQTPYYLLSREFFTELRGSMKPGGIVLMNIISPLKGPRSMMFQSIMRTMDGVFNHTQVYPLSEDRTKIQNIIIVASNQPLVDKETLMSRAADTQVMNKTKIGSMIGRMLDEQMAVDGGVVLTDDYNPINHMYDSMRGY